MDRTGFPDWDGEYRILRTLKKAEDRETCLLEAADGGLFVLKRAVGQAKESLARERELAGLFPEETAQYRQTAEADWLLRPYVPGQSLEELADREGPLSVEETAELGVKLCGRLADLHGRTPPVIHRDLKPENVILTPAGRVRLIDLGAAREYKPGQETDTVPIGTRGYAAPEQYGYGQTDARTDIYALGRVLLYLAAGGCDDSAFDCLTAGPERALKKIILRCCAYDPASRYPDIAHVRRALERLWDRCRHPKGRLAVSVLAGALALAVLLAAGLGADDVRLRRALTGYERPAAAVAGWDQSVYKDRILDIVEQMRAGDYEAMAAACEELVRDLSAEPAIAGTEPVAYEQLSAEELTAYYAGRMGYEFIADHLAADGGVLLSRLGDYGRSAQSIAMSLRSDLELSWTDENGDLRRSDLYWLAVEGDERNIDGAILAVLGAVARGLDQ